jgi:hypothetical protein
MDTPAKFETLDTERERVRLEHESVTAQLAVPTPICPNTGLTVVEALNKAMDVFNVRTSELAAAVDTHNKAKTATLTAYKLALDARLVEFEAKTTVSKLITSCDNIGKDVDKYRGLVGTLMNSR